MKKRDIEEHVFKLNEEMGIVQNDVDWIKCKLDKVDTRTWYILATIIGMGILGILTSLVV